MRYHTEDEIALIEDFRQNGGKKMYGYLGDLLIAPKPEAKALKRLLRSGHIERDCSGDFNWVQYRLREKRPDPEQAEPAAQQSTAPDA